MFEIEPAAKTRERVQSAPRVGVVKIVRADVGNPIADVERLFRPAAIFDREFLAENRLPVHVEKNEAALKIERVPKFHLRSGLGQIEASFGVSNDTVKKRFIRQVRTDTF